jgi:transposase
MPVPRELLTAGLPLDVDLEIERQRRLELLKAELGRMLAAGNGQAAIDRMLSIIVDLERENERLIARVLRANRYRFGRRSEKLSPEELQQLVLGLGGLAEESAATGGTAGPEPDVPAPAAPEQVEDPSAPAPEPAPAPETGSNPPPKKKRQRVKRMKVAPTVVRNVKTVPVPPEEENCGLCGRPKKVFTYERHETIRFVPAHVEVDVEEREVAGCELCRKDVSVAPRQEVPAVVRRVDASLLAKLVTDKCALGLPLDRQRRELGRMGLEAPDKTLGSYWAYTTDLLEPIAVATLSLAFGQPIVGADDTVLRTLDASKKGGLFRGHLWCFVGTDGTIGGPEVVGYGYTPTWEATEIQDWFSAIDGFIQCDGYGGYAREVEDEDGQRLVAVPPERRLGCGMHIRSKFHAALEARDRRAAIALGHFADLYRIEDECRHRGLDAEARTRERRLRSLPILDAFDAWVDRLHPQLVPKSPLRRATTYAINQRDFFRRCFEDGRFEIDNGRTERRIKLFATARRGFLFTGSVRGGERLAVAFTLVDNCLIRGLDPWRYLVDVIGKIERGWPARLLSRLIPQNWAADQAAEQYPE